MGDPVRPSDCWKYSGAVFGDSSTVHLTPPEGWSLQDSPLDKTHRPSIPDRPAVLPLLHLRGSAAPRAGVAKQPPLYRSYDAQGHFFEYTRNSSNRSSEETAGIETLKQPFAIHPSGLAYVSSSPRRYSHRRGFSRHRSIIRSRVSAHRWGLFSRRHIICHVSSF